MIVKTHELVAGYVLCQDVYAKSTKPMMPKGTVLSDTHIQFLKAFLMNSVDAEAPDHVSGRRKSLAKDDADSSAEHEAFFVGDEVYLQAVDNYRNFFTQWQSGESFDIGNFRRAFMPAIKEVLAHPMRFAALLINQIQEPGIAERSILLGCLAAFFAERFKLSSGDCIQLGLAGMLADCGLARLSPDLLKKKELTGSEQQVFSRHVSESYKMLKGTATLREDTLTAIAQHHEREDGRGYPLKLNGTQISLNGKILAVCDSFLTQKAIEPSGSMPDALDHLSQDSCGKLSPYILNRFSYELMSLFTGMNVALSDDRIGTISFIPVKSPTRPIISLENNQVLSLAENSGITIEHIF